MKLLSFARSKVIHGYRHVYQLSGRSALHCTSHSIICFVAFFMLATCGTVYMSCIYSTSWKLINTISLKNSMSCGFIQVLSVLMWISQEVLFHFQSVYIYIYIRCSLVKHVLHICVFCLLSVIFQMCVICFHS